MNDSVRPRIDYTNKDYASLVEGMLRLARERVPEWTDHSPNDLGVVLLELFATMGDALFYHQDRIAAESYLETASERRSVLHLLRLIGYELRPPVPASADLTLLFALDTVGDAAGRVQIDTLAQFSTRGGAGVDPIAFRYLGEPLRVVMSALPRGTVDAQGRVTLIPEGAPLPKGTVFRVYRTLPVVQVDAAVKDEIVGSSDGTPGQRFALARAPLIDGSLALRVSDGAVEKTWRRVASLLQASPDDESYAVRRESVRNDQDDVAWIELGDGRYGKPPPRGRNNLVVDYLVGGGAKGNVPPGAISEVVTSIEGLKLASNERAASGGAHAEKTADAVKRGPRQFRSMRRAVTASDFESHALAFGVAKARAFAPGANRVELYVAPAGGGLPSDTLEQDLLGYFEPLRMMTTALSVKGPKYVDVAIHARLVVEPRFSQVQVQKRAEDAILTLWSFDEVDFGDTLYLSKIYEAIEAVDGVAAVTVRRFSKVIPGIAIIAPIDLPFEGKLTFAPHEIPRLAHPRGVLFLPGEGDG